jgi:putative transposase
VRLCRQVDHAALGERRAAWRTCGVTVGSYQQKAERPASKGAMPDYGEVHSQVLQDVVLRVERAYQAFFRRAWTGETAGSPRCQGRHRSHSFTSPHYDNGARLANGVLVLSQIGRIAVRWSRPLAGTPKTVTIAKEADGWYVCCSCADVPTPPLPPTGNETGIDVGLKVFLITAEGLVVDHPRHARHAEPRVAKAGRRVSRRKQGRQRRRQAVGHLPRAHQTMQRPRADFQHQTARTLVRAYEAISLEDVRVANLVRNRHLATSIADAG